MDTSKEYIEMCKKAQEIQKRLGGVLIGDFLYYESTLAGKVVGVVTDLRYKRNKNKTQGCTINILNKDNLRVYHIENTKRGVWLPRQDQLQEIYGNPINHKYPIYNNIWLFYGFAHRNYIPVSKEESETGELAIGCKYSMEQLWLVFVMREKYNKRWNPETKEWEVI